jgi:hypothetical protein
MSLLLFFLDQGFNTVTSLELSRAHLLELETCEHAVAMQCIGYKCSHMTLSPRTAAAEASAKPAGTHTTR